MTIPDPKPPAPVVPEFDAEACEKAMRDVLEKQPLLDSITFQLGFSFGWKERQTREAVKMSTTANESEEPAWVTLLFQTWVADPKNDGSYVLSLNQEQTEQFFRDIAKHARPRTV